MSPRPLESRKILVTRTRAQASAFASTLNDRGAEVFEIPTIEIIPIQSPELDDALHTLSSFDWLFFTSVNGVDCFFQRGNELGCLTSDIPKICTIGPATSKKVRDHGHEVTLQPTLYQAEGVLEAFSTYRGGGIEGLRILLPRARVAREILPEQLRSGGATVDLIPVYETVVPVESRTRLQKILDEHQLDLVTFTSSSTVHNFVEIAGNIDRIRGLQYAAIGPITAETANEYGLQVVVMAEESTIPALAQAIEQYFSAG